MSYNILELTNRDVELLNAAKMTIESNYDSVNYNHTVGAALRTKNGKIYTGINVYSIHGICAEQTVIGAALTNGEREFETIVAVRGIKGEEVLPPCGNCRQMLIDYMPKGNVIICINGVLKKIKIKELLPFPYSFDS